MVIPHDDLAAVAGQHLHGRCLAVICSYKREQHPHYLFHFLKTFTLPRKTDDTRWETAIVRNKWTLRQLVHRDTTKNDVCVNRNQCLNSIWNNHPLPIFRSMSYKTINESVILQPPFDNELEIIYIFFGLSKHNLYIDLNKKIKSLTLLVLTFQKRFSISTLSLS